MKFIVFLILPIFLLANNGILHKIVDGDTLYFKGQYKITKCRIQYIDTPESYESSKLKRDLLGCDDNVKKKDMISAGKSATRAARRLLNLGQNYKYSVSGTDHYGRSICIVHLSGQETFNKAMIRLGYAIPFRRYLKNSEKKYFENILDAAIAQKNGLWSTHFKEMKCLNYDRR